MAKRNHFTRATQREARGCLAAVCGGYLLLATSTSLLVPAWEANDEMAHAANIEYMALHGGIPPLHLTARFAIPGTPRYKKIDWHESHQPPLYYFLAALWQRLIGVPAFAPHPLDPSGWNGDDPPLLIYHHAYDSEHYLQAVACHRLRLLSVLIGLGTVLLIYAAAHMALGCRAFALATAAFVAFLPKFMVISAVISNDGLAIFLATLTLVLLLHRWRKTFRGFGNWWNLIALGVTAGAGVLTKLNCLPSLAIVLPALLLQRESIGQRLRDTVVTATAFLAVVGWWAARNLRLYGDALGTEAATAWLRSVLPAYVSVVPWLDAERFVAFLPRTLLRSMWYTGGWNQFALPFGWNLTLCLIASFALVGAWRAFRRGQVLDGTPLQRAMGWILAGWVAAGLAAAVIIARYTPQGEARVAYVGIGGFAPLVTLGLCEWLGTAHWRRRLALTFWPAVFLALDAYVFWRFQWPFAGL